jgi:hypothetical protein
LNIEIEGEGTEDYVIDYTTAPTACYTSKCINQKAKGGMVGSGKVEPGKEESGKR